MSNILWLKHFKQLIDWIVSTQINFFFFVDWCFIIANFPLYVTLTNLGNILTILIKGKVSLSNLSFSLTLCLFHILAHKLNFDVLTKLTLWYWLIIILTPDYLAIYNFDIYEFELLFLTRIFFTTYFTSCLKWDLNPQPSDWGHTPLPLDSS